MSQSMFHNAWSSKLLILMTQSAFCQNLFWVFLRVNGGQKKERKKEIKQSYLFQTTPEIVHQSSKGQRVIAATDYFNSATLQSYFILTMCLIPFHSLNGSSDWLSAVLKEANQTVRKATPPSAVQQACTANRPSCFQTAQSFPSPVEQHSLTSASTSASTARAPAPAPA